MFIDYKGLIGNFNPVVVNNFNILLNFCYSSMFYFLVSKFIIYFIIS